MPLFPKKSRLLDSKAFRCVFNRAVCVQAPPFRLYACTNGLGFARLGIVVGKKNLPKAVFRNKVKRLVRESFRAHQDALAGRDVVVVATRSIYKIFALQNNQEKTWDALRPKWEKLFKLEPLKAPIA